MYIKKIRTCTLTVCHIRYLLSMLYPYVGPLALVCSFVHIYAKYRVAYASVC